MPDIEPTAGKGHVTPTSELVSVASEFGKYLETLPNKSAVSSQACKFVYEHFPAAHDILSRHGHLKGLVRSCPYLHIEGSSHKGTYILSRNHKIFSHICLSYISHS